MMEILKNPNFEFLGYRKIAISVSLVIIGLGLLSIIVRGGLKYGIDFTVGAAIQLQFEQEVGAEQVREALRRAGMVSYEVTHFGDRSHVMIRLQLAESGQNYLSAIQNQFTQIFPNNRFIIEQNDLVGPKIGTEMREKALLALLFSMIGVIIYISIRFEAESFMGVLLTLLFGLIVLTISSTKVVLESDVLTVILIILASVVVSFLCLKFNFKYAVGAIVAVIHDVLVTVSIFAILDKEINLTIVAALLTIVGYSLNDTIVIFDRIREEFPKERKRMPLDRIINKCVNITLSRTIITSLTVMIVVLVLLIFGGEVIRPFTLAMFIGLVAGTYSTIYIASPVLIFWQKKFGGGEELVTRKAPA